jgi:hypothetical protein
VNATTRECLLSVTQFRRIERLALRFAAAAAIGLAFVAPAHASSSANLIVNGGGESGTCSADWYALTTVPGWTVVQGYPSETCYSVASFTTPSSPAPGNAFIADGPWGDAALTQTVNVASAGSTIDAGGVTYSFTGWLGGWGSDTGQAVVTAVFLNSSGAPVGTPAQLSGGTASARSNNDEFLAESATGTVPVGTRSIQVLIQFIDTDSHQNVGYVDNLSLTLSTPVTPASLTVPVSQVPAFDHVFIIQMENTTYTQVIGDTTDAPYINGLASQGTLLTNYSAAYHPSDENYLAIAGGATYAVGAVYYPNIKDPNQNLGDTIEAVGKTWKAYEQGMGTPCNTSNNNDSYYYPDDAPFFNYTDVANNATRCAAHLFDTSQLTTDLQSASTTPNFSWIAADDYYDGEASGNGSSQSLQVQNGWLQTTIGQIMASPAWTTQRSLLILTWDESDAGTANNHIATFLVGSQGLVKSGVYSTSPYNHYGTGSTIEHALGLPAFTGNDQYAQPINDAFTGAAPSASALTTLTPVSTQGANIMFGYQTTASNVSSSNWIGIYSPGQTPGGSASSTTWEYTPSAGGVMTMSTSGLAAGNYVAYYLYNDGYTVLAGPVPFTITP